MESAEGEPAKKSVIQGTHELTVCQTTEKLDTWKLNEQQQQLVDASGARQPDTHSRPSHRSATALCSWHSSSCGAKRPTLLSSMALKWHSHSGTLPIYWGFWTSGDRPCGDNRSCAQQVS